MSSLAAGWQGSSTTPYFSYRGAANGGVEIAVQLTPRGGSDRIEGSVETADGCAWLGERVSAAPESGKANRALVKLLAKTLGVAVGDITIVSGASSRRKRLRVAGMSPVAAAKRLQP